MAYAAVEPYIEDVLFLDKFGAAAFALCACGDNILNVLDEPGVGAFLAEHIGNCLDSLVGNNGLAAVLAVNNGNGNAPCSLTGDAPVAAVVYHTLYSVLAPLRDPLNIADSLNSLSLEVLYGAEPLLGSSEQNGVLASPAVRILVDDLFQCEQCA